jgi:hypothetical protein
MDKLKVQDPQKNNEPSLTFMYRFFCWCSGVRLYLLKHCPSEFNKYYGIGVIVFLTGVMASLSGGYAIFTVFRNIYLSALFGVFWGFLIFSIDWYIVASLRKQHNKYREFLTALPRFVLAVLIAFVVSMPLKMKLFEREIEQQILFEQQNSILEYQSLVSTEFSDIQRIEKENEVLRNELAEKEKQRNALFTMIIAEAEGLSPTKLQGKGPVYREKKAEYDKVDAELIQLRELNTKLINNNITQLQTLRDRRENVMQYAQKTNRESDGFLARLKAMNTLSAANRSILFASWFIILLFITIESAPIIVKLLSARGPYDDLLEAEEYKKQIEINRDVIKAELKEDHQINLTQLLEKERNDILYLVEKEHINAEAKVLTELNLLKVDKWKQEEMAKLNLEPSTYGLTFSSSIIDTDKEEVDEKNLNSNTFEHSESIELKDIPYLDDDIDDSILNADEHSESSSSTNAI